MSLFRSFLFVLLISSAFALEHPFKPHDLYEPCDVQFWSHCPPYSICLNGRCECQFGYIAHNGSGRCLGLACEDNAECVKNFGANSMCYDTLKRCTCDETHLLNHYTQQCDIPMYFRLGERCKGNYLQSCGRNTFCGEDETCHCKMGYVRDADGIHCSKMHCSTTVQCLREFGGDIQCVESSCECAVRPNNWTFLNQTTQICQRQKCERSYDCPVKDSLCVSSQCQCPFGKYLAPSSRAISRMSLLANPVCTDILCRDDGDCGKRFANSKCAQEKCVCKDGFHLSNQQCTSPNNGLITDKVIRILVILAIVFACILVVGAIFLGLYRLYLHTPTNVEIEATIRPHESLNRQRRRSNRNNNIHIICQNASNNKDGEFQEDLPPSYNYVQVKDNIVKCAEQLAPPSYEFLYTTNEKMQNKTVN